MRSALGLVGLLITLGIGYMIYTSQMRHIPGDKPLKQQIDLVGIEGDLRSLAQAERLYLASNGSYASLDQLRSFKMMNTVPPESRSSYRYSVEVDGADHFKIMAIPINASRQDLPTLSIDETLQITQ